MNVYNPASLFYFSVCLRLENDETVLCHSITETLTRRSSNQAELLQAIRSLTVSDTPFLIYSFNHVLDAIALMDRYHPSINETLKTYTGLFVPLFAANDQTIILKIFQGIIDGSADKDQLKLIMGLAKHISPAADISQSSLSLPYIDISEFAVESIILDLANYFCQKKEVANQFAEYLQRNTKTELYLLTSDGYEHKKGRQCFLASVRLKRTLGLAESNEKFKLHIWENTAISTLPALEPDLTFLFLQHWFLFADANIHDTDKLKSIESELLSFKLFSECMAGFDKQGKEQYLHGDYQFYLSTLFGKYADTGFLIEKNRLSVNIWIGCLYLLISEHFPVSLSYNLLIECWRPFIPGEPGIALTTRSPFLNEQIEIIVNQKTGNQANSKKKIVKNKKALTPWMTYNDTDKVYIELESFASWVRILCGVRTSISVILQDPGPSTNIFRAFLVHSAELVSQLKSYYHVTVSDKKEEPIKQKITATLLKKPQMKKILALLERDLFYLVGGDNLYSIPRYSFVTLTHFPEEQENVFVHFHQIVVPKILYAWLYRSIQNIDLDINASILKNEILALENSVKLNINFKNKLRLLRKYLFNDPITLTQRSTHIQDNVLLLNPGDISDIVNEAARLNSDASENNKNMIAFASSAKRYHYSLLFEVAEEPATRKELLTRLKNIRKGEDIYYLNRLELISVFENFERIDDNNVELFILITDILFEVGGLLDISLLTKNVFSKLLSGENDSFNAAQIKLLNCLAIHISTSLRYTIHITGESRSAIDPVSARKKNRKIHFLRCTLSTMQYIVIKYKSVLGSRVKIYNHYGIENEDYRLEKKMVSVEEGIPVFDLTINNKNPLLENVLVTYNTIEQTSLSYIKDTVLPAGVLNLFSREKTETEKLFKGPGETFFVLAICRKVTRRRNEMFYRFETAPDIFEEVYTEEYDIKENEKIILKYIFKYGKFIIDKQFYQRLDNDKSSNTPYITITALTDVVRRGLSLECWVPNHSDIHTGFIKQLLKKGAQQTLIDSNKNPVYSFFNGLIESLAPDPSSFIILTFIARIWEPNRQEYGYLFYESFGLNYIIFEDEITIPQGKDGILLHCIEQLAKEEELEIDSLTGLIVSFRVDINNTDITLRLAEEGVQQIKKQKERYPQLITPFDTRNLRWERLFDESEERTYTALVENGLCIYKTGEEWENLGFPKSIGVTLDKKPPRTDQEVEFIVQEGGWKKDKGRFILDIIGKRVLRSDISLDELKKYLQLRLHQQIEINNFNPSPNQVTVIGYTTENIRVTIPLEELTLSPVNLDQPVSESNFSRKPLFIGKIISWRPCATDPIIIDLPKWLTDSGSFTGYFIDVPRRTSDKIITSYSLALQQDDGEIKDIINVIITNASEKNIQNMIGLYARLTGNVKNGVWNFSLSSRQIFLKSGWQIKEIIDQNLEDLFFVGTARFKNQLLSLYERGNYDKEIFYSSQPLSRYIQNDLFTQAGIIREKDWKCRFIGNTPRIAFENKLGVLISGEIHGLGRPQPGQAPILRSINYNLNQQNGDLFYISRSLVLGVDERIFVKSEETAGAVLKEKEIKKRWALLDKYFSDPIGIYGQLDIRTLDATLLPQSNLQWIPIKDDWVKKISIKNSPADNIEDLVFIPSAVSNYDPKKIVFWLIRKEDNSIAATSRYGYETLEDLYERLESDTDETDENEVGFFFVDKEIAHPFTRIPHEEEMYRFEAGIGWNILIPARKLTWHNKPIKTADLDFFHGDMVRKIRFYHKEIKGVATLFLDILEVEKSQAHELFIQAFRHNIYHIATVARESGRLVVNSIRGADIYSIHDKRMTYDFKKIVATIRQEDASILFERFDQDSTKIQRNVLVKIDTEFFRKKGRLHLKLCRMSFLHSDKMDCLKIKRTADNRHLTPKVIMQFGEIEVKQNGNDYFINVSPLQLLDKEDIGDDFGNGCIFRRDFSMHEGMLREYFRRDQRNFFDQYEAYVTVYPNKYNENRLLYSLTLNGEFRPEKVLLGQKRFIAIAKYDSHRNEPLTVELRPGNFFRLQNKSISFTQQSSIITIKEKDVLNITVDGKKFTVEHAIASDERFVLNNRPIVALPMDNIRNNIQNRSFTLGSFPNVLREMPNVLHEQFTQFMIDKHPKIAVVTEIDDKGFLRLPSLDESYLAGYFQIASGDLAISFISYNSTESFSVNLSRLTFYEGSLLNLINRMKNCRWQYHDEKTWRLSRSNASEIRQVRIPLSNLVKRDNVDNCSGPVFAELLKHQVSFRYRRNLLFWSYPVSSLIDCLDSNKGEFMLTYAGTENNIHFAEIAPGRIVELPVNLLMYPASSPDFTMKDYAWNALVPGDKIVLQNTSGDITDNFKINLVSIHHSTRNVLSKNNKLPVKKINKQNGALEIGAGNSFFTLPFAADNIDPAKPVLFLNLQNEVSQSDELIILSIGDTILVTVNDIDKIMVSGWEIEIYYHVLPQSRYIKTLIKAAGNALFATIVAEKPLRFELPVLNPENVNGKILSAIVVGLLDDAAKSVVVKIGGYFEIIPFDTMIGGVSAEHRKFVIAGLIGRQVWLTVTFDQSHENYSFTTGLNVSAPGEEFYVSKVKHIVDESNVFLGTLCHAAFSQKYYWLPKKEMAWCSVTLYMADIVFYNINNNELEKRVNPIRVSAQNNTVKSISRIRTAELINAFHSIKCGLDKMDVIIVPIDSADANAVNGKLSFTGYSRIYKTLVQCESFSARNISELSIIERVEVLEKDHTSLKMKLLHGERKTPVYLPLYSNRASAKLPVNATNDSINNYYQMTGDKIINNASSIISLASKMFTPDSQNPVSLLSGFMMLRLLWDISERSSATGVKTNRNRLLNLLQINLLRQISIENINQKEIHLMTDDYQVMLLSDSLKAFLPSPVADLTELEYSRLRKTASTMRFYNAKAAYPAVGNAILQVLGLPSHVSLGSINNSVLHDMFITISGFKENDTEVIGKIENIVVKIRTNQMNLILLIEKTKD